MISDPEKDKNINFVLRELYNRFGAESFKLTDYWDADISAAGIKSKTDGKYLIYISVWNQLPNTYFAEVEKANSNSDLTDYSAIERFENIYFEMLSELVDKYLI